LVNIHCNNMGVNEMKRNYMYEDGLWEVATVHGWKQGALRTYETDVHCKNGIHTIYHQELVTPDGTVYVGSGEAFAC